MLQDKSYAQSFEFLGHQFRKCRVKAKGAMKLLYSSRISRRSKQKMLQELKYAKLHRRTDRIEQLAKELNLKVQGWVSYFGKYGGSSMHRMFKRQAIGWLRRKWEEKPMLFIHGQQTRWFCYYNRNASQQVST